MELEWSRGCCWRGEGEEVHLVNPRRDGGFEVNPDKLERGGERCTADCK